MNPISINTQFRYIVIAYDIPLYMVIIWMTLTNLSLLSNTTFSSLGKESLLSTPRDRGCDWDLCVPGSWLCLDDEVTAAGCTWADIRLFWAWLGLWRWWLRWWWLWWWLWWLWWWLWWCWVKSTNDIRRRCLARASRGEPPPATPSPPWPLPDNAGRCTHSEAPTSSWPLTSTSIAVEPLTPDDCSGRRGVVCRSRWWALDPVGVTDDCTAGGVVRNRRLGHCSRAFDTLGSSRAPGGEVVKPLVL